MCRARHEKNHTSEKENGMLKRRILSLLMALVMVLSMTVSSYAEGSRQGTVPAEGETVSEETGAEAEPVDEEPAALEYHELHITYKNPLYGGAGKIVEEETEGVLETPEVFHSDGEETVYSVEDAAGVFREAMKERETTISFSLVVDHSVDREEVNALSDALTALALSHTGVPTEGDYLLYQYGGFEGRMGWSTDGGQSTVHYTYTVDYYTTKAQEDMVDAAVSELISSLNLSGADEYHKIRAVYDWMTHNIVYDKANLNNASYLLKYTAYAALINRTSVCQGYAVLLYRLLLTCGIDCRIISGLGDGNNGPEAHAWNIAQIGQYYFNLDATWDAPRAVNNLDFEYYLRADSTFTGHTRGTFNDNNDYTSAEFYAAYPMSAEDYSGLVAWNYDLTEYTVDPGDNVTLSVGASSDVGEVTFAWRRDGVMLDGEEGTTLQLYDIQENSSVTCIVSDGVSTVELDFFIYIRAIQSELTVYTEDSQFDLWYGDILNLYVDAWSNSEISYTW